MTFQFGHAVLNLPAAVLSCTDADAAQWRVLLWLASDPTLSQKPRQLAKLADCSQAQAADALRYWIAQGILTESEEEPSAAPLAKAANETKKAPSVGKKLLQRADELPIYSSVELTALLEKRAGVRAVVDEAQQILGKIFNISELNILVGMLDYLGLSEEAVLMLLSHCRNIGKTNLRAIEKYAYQIIDRGITEPEALEEEFRTAEAMRTFEGQVRSLFGMKARELTTRESKMLREWISFGYDIDIVRRAYEMTVNATNEPSVPYANSILERWHADGLATLADIERAEEADKQKKNKKAGGAKGTERKSATSFDIDDFFEAALSRSFEDPTADPKK